jgi:hypothetical protein
VSPSDTRDRSHVYADTQEHRGAVDITVAPASAVCRDQPWYRNINSSWEYVRQCFEGMFITRGVSQAVAGLGEESAFHLPRREAEVALEDELVYIQFLPSSIVVTYPSPLLLASRFASHRSPWNARSSFRGMLGSFRGSHCNPNQNAWLRRAKKGRHGMLQRRLMLLSRGCIDTCVRCLLRQHLPHCCSNTNADSHVSQDVYIYTRP